MMTMRMEKVPVILVVCMLLFSSLGLAIGIGPAECCFRYRDARLPKDNVVAYQRTHIHCGKDGIVFTMKNGMKFCADPAVKWVKELITHVESTAQLEGSG